VKNPFQFGRELGASEIVDRAEEVAAVVETIKSGSKLFLIGPRRYGKTSILRAAAERSEATGAVVLSYNVEAYPTLDSLARVILTDATARLVGNVEKAGERIRRFFSALRPEVSYSMTEGTWSASLGVEADEQDTQVPLLIELLDGLERLAADVKTPVGLILDEFQKVIELGGKEAEGQLRAGVQRHKKVGYVFAGSKTRMLTDMTSDPARPFYRLGSRRFIGAVPRADFTEFITKSFTDSRFKPKPEAVTLILDLAEDVPYNVQLLAHTCWEELRGVQGSTLTEEIVREGRARIVNQDDPFYTQIWNALTPTQQRALIAVVREGGTNLLSKGSTKLYRLPPSTMQRALEALVARDILREEETQGSVRLRFEDPFLAAWIHTVTAKN